MSICNKCFHSYVCEEFNNHRGCDNKKCHFANDHFIPADLIYRQKEEIEMDDVEIKELRIALQGYLDDLTKERNLYKKSIEELNQAKAEIERLKTENKLLIENDISNKYPNCVLVEKGRIYTRTLEDYDELIGDISAEAYREFAELLKQQKYQSSDWSHGEHPYVVEESDIDNTLNDLVGDENG